MAKSDKTKKSKIDVAGTTVRRDDKLLVIKRTDGKWDIPKGHVDPGETPYEAAKREAGEETRLPVKINRERYKDVKSGKDRKYRIFKGEVASGSEPELDPHEHSKAKWLDKKSAMKKLKVSPHLAKAVANLESVGMDVMKRTPLRTEATTTANIATFMTPLAPPMNRSPLRYQGYEHGKTQPDLCKKCKKLGYICPECPGSRKA